MWTKNFNNEMHSINLLNLRKVHQREVVMMEQLIKRTRDDGICNRLHFITHFSTETAIMGKYYLWVNTISCWWWMIHSVVFMTIHSEMMLLRVLMLFKGPSMCVWVYTLFGIQAQRAIHDIMHSHHRWGHGSLLCHVASRSHLSVLSSLFVLSAHKQISFTAFFPHANIQ